VVHSTYLRGNTVLTWHLTSINLASTHLQVLTDSASTGICGNPIPWGAGRPMYPVMVELSSLHSEPHSCPTNKLISSIMQNTNVEVLFYLNISPLTRTRCFAVYVRSPLVFRCTRRKNNSSQMLSGFFILCITQRPGINPPW